MSKTYSVYKHTSPSGKVYIGITCQKPANRWDNGHGYRHNLYFSRAIEKHGWDAFSHEIICAGLTREQACALEMHLISAYKSNDPRWGYNGTHGGECNAPSDTTRAKMSAARRGKPAHNKGKKLSDAWRQHLRESHAVISEETRAKQRAARLGKPLSDGAKAKISKSVVCIETGVAYNSAKQAAIALGVPSQNISACCRGKRKTVGGKHFAFIEQGEGGEKR